VSAGSGGAPAVSVVIPTFDAPELLASTLDAVLAQTFADREVIVVDDGSGPRTAAVLAALRGAVTVLCQEHGGAARARNAGLAAARGEWIALCDHDDLWAPEHLARMVACARATPRAGLCFCQAVPMDEHGAAGAPFPDRGPGPDAFAALLQESLVPTCSAVMVRRDLVLAAGGFDPAFAIADDYDLWFRLARRTRFLFVREPLVRWRRHHGNASRASLALHQEKARLFDRLARESDGLASAVRRAIDRRRVQHRVAIARCHRREGCSAESRASLREAAAIAPWSWRVMRERFHLLALRTTPMSRKSACPGTVRET
jgi:glycosyltransferase involved in cell wall biosynthesis